MLRGSNSYNGIYLTPEMKVPTVTSNSVVTVSFRAFMSLCLAFFVILSTVAPSLSTLFSQVGLTGAESGSVASSGYQTAYADDEDDDDDKKSEDLIKKAAEDSGVKTDDEGFADALRKSNGASDRNNSFFAVLGRIFAVGYLNNVNLAVTPSGYSKPDSGYMCSVDNKFAGTPLYHNCDIPNLMTEFMQDTADIFLMTGPQSANTDYSAIDNPAFGLPSSSLPGDGTVPVADNLKSVKYSALELYGYNLKYSLYRGEWDHIKVYTSARMLSNFGFSDRLKTGVASIVNGVTGAVSSGTKTFVSGISEGNILKAISGTFTAVTGGASASINTILDTADLNVSNTYAWYRAGYGGTLYGARELSNDELSEIQKEQLQQMLTAGAGEDVKLPDDFKKLSTPPEAPKEKISKCEVKTTDGKWEEKLHSDQTPGPSKSDCEAEAKKVNSEKPETRWSDDGSVRGQTLQEWREQNSSWFYAAGKYKMKCTIDTSSEKDRTKKLSDFMACVPGEYSRLAREKASELKDEASKQWMNKTITQKFFSLGNIKFKSSNFNAPWNRFICLNPDGSDMVDGNGNWRGVYSDNGELTGNCNAIRKPIQNGLYGNGYDTSQANQTPGVDTRNSRLPGIVETLIPIDQVANMFANGGLSTAVFFTRVSNTMLNLSFAPILQSFKFDQLVIDLIKDFRESVFMPLSLVFIGASAVWIFIKGAKTGGYREAMVSLCFIALAFIFGSALTMRPDTVVRTIDELPAQLSGAITGNIYGAGKGNNDDLCTVTGTPAAKATEDLSGKILPSSVNDANREMLCENWRVNAFNPWLQGQWGTNYTNLYANGSGKDHTLTNSNGNLVGDASVNMGGGVTEKNWALYQLKVTTAGTATTKDPTINVGNVNPNFYRIVDAQAGPNNGEGTDSRYFAIWSGDGTAIFPRLGIGITSPISSGLSMVAVIVYSAQKIILSFVTVGLLLVIPFIFLIGMFPSARPSMKRYFGNIFGLIAQQVVLVTLLALMMKVLTAVGESTVSIMLATILTSATALLFLYYRKKALDAIMRLFTGGMAESMSFSQMMSRLPKGVRNSAQSFRRGTKGMVEGAVGGFVTGGVKGAARESTRSASVEMRKAFNSQRRRGFSMGQVFGQAVSKAGDEAKKDQLNLAKKRFDKEGLNEKISSRTNEEIDRKNAAANRKEDKKTAKANKKQWDEMSFSDKKKVWEENGVTPGETKDFVPAPPTREKREDKVLKPTDTSYLEHMSPSQIKRLNKAMDKIEANRKRMNKGPVRVGTKSSLKDPSSEASRSLMESDARTNELEHYRVQDKIDKNQGKLDNLIADIAIREADHAEVRQNNQRFKENLASMRDQFQQRNADLSSKSYVSVVNSMNSARAKAKKEAKYATAKLSPLKTKGMKEYAKKVEADKLEKAKLREKIRSEASKKRKQERARKDRERKVKDAAKARKMREKKNGPTRSWDDEDKIYDEGL